MATSFDTQRQTFGDAAVILPLYVYPSKGAWEPVYAMASTYPRVQFTVIINPNSGPGECALPDDSYTEAIRRLNSMDNVRTIGYVATTWCTRSLGSVLDDITLYAEWGNFDPSLAMTGIFFDETPTSYTPEHVSYLQTISQTVRSNHGLTDGFVVHNPGALPEAPYLSDPTFVEVVDLTIIFEDAYASWGAARRSLIQETQSHDRPRLALMLHSTPRLSYSDTKEVLQQLLKIGHSIWLTKTRNYTEIDPYFPVFVDCLHELLS